MLTATQKVMASRRNKNVTFLNIVHQEILITLDGMQTYSCIYNMKNEVQENSEDKSSSKDHQPHS